MVKKIIAKPYILSFFLIVLYGCPQAISHKYKEINSVLDINKNSIIKYKNDSIDVYLSYIHFFGNKRRNILIANLNFLSKNSISKNDYNIEISSTKFGILKNIKIPSDYLVLKSSYHSNLKKEIDTNNIFRFQKIVGTKESLRKIKKDTIKIIINNKTYLFRVPNKN